MRPTDGRTDGHVLLWRCVVASKKQVAIIQKATVSHNYLGFKPLTPLIPASDPHKYEYKQVYWEILAIKFAFVVVFENVVLLTKSCVAWIIPDNPKKLKEQMKREQTITQSLILQVRRVRKVCVGSKGWK